jgi:hypothetical protein
VPAQQASTASPACPTALPSYPPPPQGYLEIGRTTFIIIIILLVGAVVFIKDTDRLVLKPLERMVQLVRRRRWWWEVGLNERAG